MCEIIIDSIDHDTAKKHAVITWRRKEDGYNEFLVVPLKDWNRQVEFEGRSSSSKYILNSIPGSQVKAARFFLMQLDVIPMAEEYLSPVDHTPVPQYE